METIGNTEIWKLPKSAFLCSRKVPAAQVLKCYDWAISMREAGKCVMLGAHSQLEKDVLHYLLKGAQPVIIVLARGMKERVEPELMHEIEKERLLIVAPFAKSVQRVSTGTAAKRNAYIIAHADDLVVGHRAESGALDRMLSAVSKPWQEL